MKIDNVSQIDHLTGYTDIDKFCDYGKNTSNIDQLVDFVQFNCVNNWKKCVTSMIYLSDLKIQKMFNIIVNFLENPDSKGFRGTAIYCLKNYDCSKIISLIERLYQESDNYKLFEQGMEAEVILHSYNYFD